MTYRFLELDIDEDSFQLRRAGGLVTVEPRVLELIIHLLRNRERMVPRSELLRHVWQGYVVGESAITRCVCLARRAVGNAAAIRTVFARGYQWVAPVDCVGSGAAPGLS